MLFLNETPKSSEVFNLNNFGKNESFWLLKNKCQGDGDFKEKANFGLITSEIQAWEISFAWKLNFFYKSQLKPYLNIFKPS